MAAGSSRYSSSPPVKQGPSPSSKKMGMSTPPTSTELESTKKRGWAVYCTSCLPRKGAKRVEEREGVGCSAKLTQAGQRGAVALSGLMPPFSMPKWQAQSGLHKEKNT